MEGTAIGRERTAHLCGVPVGRVKRIVYTLAALLAQSPNRMARALPVTPPLRAGSIIARRRLRLSGIDGDRFAPAARHDPHCA
jgi:hypothetical protein